MPSYSLSLIALFSYLFGSISSAIIVSQIMGLPDPRTDGSNNPGATNVLRLGGKKAAAIVLAFDVLKSLIPVALGHAFNLPDSSLAIIGFAAVLGHVFPIYYRFAGGKGVATALGFYFGLFWAFGLLMVVIWLVCLAVFRYSSLSSLVMVGLAPCMATVMLGTTEVFTPLLFVALLIAFRHKENIERLRAGDEPQTKLFKK